MYGYGDDEQAEGEGGQRQPMQWQRGQAPMQGAPQQRSQWGGGMPQHGQHQRPDWGALMGRFQQRLAQRMPPWLQQGQGQPQQPQQAPVQPPLGAPQATPPQGGGEQRPQWMQGQIGDIAQLLQQRQGGGILGNGGMR